MVWFATLTIEKSDPLPSGGWSLTWADGRLTWIDVKQIEVAPGGARLAHKTIRWAF